MLSALEGDILGSALTPGSDFNKTYEFILPPEAGWWVADNCNVVVFVTDLSPHLMWAPYCKLLKRRLRSKYCFGY